MKHLKWILLHLMLPMLTLGVVALTPPSFPGKSSDWTGLWKSRGGNTIWIVSDGKQLRALGSATWASSEENRNYGSIYGPLFFEEKKIQIRENDCILELKRNGRILEILDSGEPCGGANVSFTGVYQRVKMPRHKADIKPYWPESQRPAPWDGDPLFK